MRLLNPILLVLILLGLTNLCHAQLNPVANNDSGTGTEDIPLSIDVVANDLELDLGQDIDPATVDLDPTSIGIQTTLTGAEGNFESDGAGNVTFTPVANFNGSVAISYEVSDDNGETSNIASINFTLNAVNDPPVITGQASLSTNEDNAITIVFGNLTVTDPDDNYPTGFTLGVSSGANYSVTGNTVTPDLNFNGMLSVPVTVNDGTDDSNTFNVQITVDAVNDAPVINGQDLLAINEDGPITLTLDDLTVTDPDDAYPTGFTLSVSNGANYSVSGNAITPTANFNGTLSVPVTVNDGDANSNTFNVQVTVNAVNDAPLITGQDILGVNEDGSITLTLNDLLVTDPDDAYPGSFTMSVSAGANYSVSGNTVTPTANFNGTLSVPVTVNDGDVNSNSFNVQITVNSVNDAPVVTGQATLSVNEDNPITITFGNLTVTDADDIYPTGFTMSLADGPNYSVSSNTVTPDLNFTGVISVPVTVNDGDDDSNTFNVQITVNAVNDAPMITGQSSLSVNEDNSITLVFGNITVTDPDDSYPTDFTMNVSTGADYTVSGNTITPNSNFNGTLSVPVTVNDGTSNSNSFNLQITVNPVNDAPVITGQSSLSINEDNSITLAFAHLTVMDPDDSYPTGFAMTVSAGANYTVVGSTVTPTSNFSGTLSVPVTINDGNANSNSFNVQITVNSVNDAPVITGQAPLSVNEDNAITLAFANLSVTDPDDIYPTGFTMNVSTGANYSVSGTTVTPSLNFSGTLSVPVTVNDGTDNSNTFNVQITVNAVNDAPVINSQAALSTNEDTPITIAFANLTVTDPDDTYPTGFTMTVSSGANYTVSGSTVTPAANFSGTLSVPVTVNDGASNSNAFNVQITVNAVNDAPIITGQASLSTNEDTPIILALANLTVTDVDDTYPTGFTMSVSAGANYTVSGSTVTPNANFSGTLSVPVTVNDGAANSNAFNVQITVNAVNDAPVINSQSTLSTNEDTAITLTFANLNVTDPDDTYPTGFTMAISTGANYTVSGNTVTPSSNFSGTLSVPVTVNDGAVNSNTFNVQITVNPINDSPVITGQSVLSVVEDNAITLALANLTVTDPDNTYPTGFTMSVSAGANYTVAGNTVTPAANFTGTLTVPVTVNDGFSNSNTFNVQITATPVNDAPAIVGQSVLTINEDNSLTLAFGHLSVSDPDNTYPSGFTMFVSSGANYTLAGNTITPTANFSGTLTVPVIVSDGAANSNIFNVQITVNAVNDAPVITGQSSLSVTEDNPITLALANLTVTDPDNTYPSGYTLTVSSGANYTFSGTTVTPASNFTGTLSVPVQVNDGTANSNTFNVQITVSGVNDAPIITGQSSLNVNEDNSLTLALNNLTVTDPDDAYPSGFTMTVSSGLNYTVSGNTITPNANYSGLLSVPVTVNDGDANSNTFNVQVTVNAVNDAPVITGQTSLSVAEDNSITLTFAHLTVTDPDNTYPSGFTLIAANGTNYTRVGNTITPSPNFTGVLSVPVTVNDGTSGSNIFNVQITVTPTNDAPVITGQSALSVNEDNSITLVFGNLTVTDPDDSYPTGFTMIVSSGANYTVSGSTITPTSNFFGTLSVPVLVDDGQLNSNTFNVQITVNPVNDKPVITNQTVISTGEDVPVTLQLTHLTVVDPDNSYPTGFTLQSSAGANYTVSGNTITPSLDFNGTLNVSVTVNDGTTASDPFIVQIQVGEANDPPMITAHTPLSVSEDQSVTLQLSHLTVTDPDNTYPTGFSLTVLSGTDYTVSGTTVTPVANFFGTLTVPVRVNDGINNSPLFNVSITVNAINDAPGFDAISNQSVAENAGTQTVNINNISKGPLESAQTLTFTATSSNTTIVAHPTVTYDGTSATAVLTYVVAPDKSGTVTITVNAVDNGSNSAPNVNNFSRTFQIEVSDVNDAPTLNAISNLNILEDAVQQNISLAGITAGPDESQTLTVEVSSDNAALFDILQVVYTSPAATGTLQLKTKPNVSGTAQVSVKVTDSGSNTAPNVNTFSRTFTVTVQAVNDAPVITGQTPSPITTGEEQAVTLTLNHLQVTDPDNAYPTGFTLTVSSGANYTVSGTTVTPAANFNGTLTVPVIVNDGTVNSVSFNVMINVDDNNDTPVITAQTAVSVAEDNSVNISLANLTVTDPDNSYPADFTMAILAGTNYTVSGNTITPSANFFGQLTIPVTVSDGNTTSAPFNFKITVNPINDAPGFDAIPNQTTAENSGAQAVTITNVSKGPLENAQELTFIATSGNTSIIPNPTITYNGTGNSATLNYTPVANKFGTVTITVIAIDNGSNVAPNNNNFTTTFQIEIVNVNTAPTLNTINNLTIQEDAAQQNISLAGITAGQDETQTLTVEATSNNPALFQTLQVVYNSPATTGTLQLKPKQNASGTAQVTVKVTDDGSAVSPNINTFSRTFTLTVQAVNDPPAFTSTPDTLAVVGELYQYKIRTRDVENNSLTVTAPVKPSWASVSVVNGDTVLTGTPSSAGNANVKLHVKDAGAPVEQSYSIYINNRPVVNVFAVETDEDVAITFNSAQFTGASTYTDANSHAMVSLLITELPQKGKLTASGINIKMGDTLSLTKLDNLLYTPTPDSTGNDIFRWKGYDGYHFSAVDAPVNITIRPLNDAPVIFVLETEALEFEVDGTPRNLTTTFDVRDIDDDSLASAEVGFRRATYTSDDVLLYTKTANINGIFDAQAGILSLSGKAPVAEYIQAIRSIQYNYLRTVDPVLGEKSVSITVNDGTNFSDTRDRVIVLKNTLVELFITEAFTPNGDGKNDFWKITGDVGEFKDASVRVYNRRGIKVFEATGLDEKWDGTFKGEVLPVDVYFYTIDSRRADKKVYQGTVTILR